jgi:aerobic C4-dicarboxylate transport protein
VQVLIGHWAGESDRAQAHRVLPGGDPFDEATMLDGDHGHGSERAQAADPHTAAALVPAGDGDDNGLRTGTSA